MSSTIVLQGALDANGVPQYFITRTGDLNANYSVTSSTASTNGWTRLMSGILLKWGSSTVNANASTTVNFDTTQVFTSVYCPMICLGGTAGLSVSPLLITGFTTTSLTVNNPTLLSGPLTFYYHVIGN